MQIDEYQKKWLLRTSAIVIFCVFVDQLTKAIARNNLSDSPVYFGDTKIGFSLNWNSGIAFSLFQSSTMLITLIAIAIITVLLVASFRTKDGFLSIIYVVIAAGAMGNLIDRFFQPPYGGNGHVTDFIQVGNFPTFNIADSLVTLGAIGLIVHTFFHMRDST